MIDPRPNPWMEQAAQDLTGALPIDFTALYTLNHKAYLRYAHIQLGSRAQAEAAVEQVFVELARHWYHVLEQPSVEAYAWATLKQEVAVRLEIQSRSLALVETAAFARVRQETRARLEALESSLGLYAAIARLPERHYDVIVLHYVLGIPQRRAARLMGIDYGTVRSHLRGARRRLARELGIVWSTDEEE